MFLTIETLFSDAGIVSAIINRVNQTRKDTIYWQQYLTFPSSILCTEKLWRKYQKKNFSKPRVRTH